MKKCIAVLLLACLILGVFVGCGEKEKAAECPFGEIRWTRETENDTEFLRFADDGSYHYYCGCGNPVDDSDLCDGYSYDPDTKTVRLRYCEDFPGAITEIVVKEFSGDRLVLDYQGDIRTFEKE